MQNQRKVIGIVLILFMFIMGYLLLSAILSQPDETQPTPAPVTQEVIQEPVVIPTVPVIRTRVPLYRGRVLKQIDFILGEIEETKIEEGMIRGDEYDIATLDGSIATRNVKGNEVLRRDDLFLKSDGNPLLFFVEDGYQVFALVGDNTSNLNRALAPGDFVDVILTILNPLPDDVLQKTKENPLGIHSNPSLGQVARTILTHRRVLAVGEKSVYGDIPQADPNFILLEVTRKEAEQLTLATVIGTTRIVLSAKNKNDPVKADEGTRATELFSIGGTIETQEVLEPPVVFRGGTN